MYVCTMCRLLLLEQIQRRSKSHRSRKKAQPAAAGSQEYSSVGIYSIFLDANYENERLKNKKKQEKTDDNDDHTE